MATSEVRAEERGVPGQRPDLPSSGILCYENRHDVGIAGATLHTHDIPEVLYILEGAGLVVRKTKQTAPKQDPITAGTVILVPPGMYHQLVDQPDNRMSVFVLAFRPDFCLLPPDMRHSIWEEPLVLLPDQSLLQPIRSLLRRMLYEQGHSLYGADTMLRILLNELLVHLTRWKTREERTPSPKDRNMARVAKVKQFLDEHYFEPVILSQVAQITDVSARRLRTLFKEATSLTMAEYLNRVRIERAKELLSTTGMAVTSICFEVGYENLSYFYRVFTDHTGLAPGTFRKRVTGGGSEAHNS